MRIAYLILTHSMPDHLGRLIGALRDEGVRTFVHVDGKVSIAPFLPHRAADVEFLDRRIDVYWGQWQMVEATLRLMARAVEVSDPDYLVLLSGSCYPIRSRRYIRGLLGDSNHLFMNSVSMPDEASHKPLSRLERFRLRSDQSWLENAVRAAPIMAHGPWPGRPFSRRWLLTRDWRAEMRLAPYAGSSWWALPSDAARYVLDVADRQRDIVRFFENTRSPDESFFQTILANSDFAPRIRRNLTYADWSSGGSHPAIITTTHIEKLARPGSFVGPYQIGDHCFARKFPDDGGALTMMVDGIVRSGDGDDSPAVPGALLALSAGS